MEIFAHPHHLHEWSAGQIRSRWDYDCPDYTLDDMIAASERLFARIDDRLRSGDLIYVTDGAGKRATLIINWIDRVRHLVAWDIDIAHSEKTVLPPGDTYTIRARGNRGNRFVILDGAGRVVVKDLMSRDEAERRLARLHEDKAA